MWRLIAAVIAIGAVVESVSKDGEEQRALTKKQFARRSGAERITRGEHRRNGAPTILQYRAALDPPPWELQVATDANGMEQFAFAFHQEFRGRIAIRTRQKRPLHLDAVEPGSKTAATDPFYYNRYRYSHPDQGIAPWFVVEVEQYYGETWRFEHESLFAKTIRERPALPASPQPTDYNSARSMVRSSDLSQRKQGARAEAQIAELRAEIKRLREEIPQLIDERKRYEQSPAGLKELFGTIKRYFEEIANFRVYIDSVDVDPNFRQEMIDIADGTLSNKLQELKRSLWENLSTTPGART